MELTQKQGWGKIYSLAVAKSFLIWSFTLAVCLLVVGFPLIVIMATFGALLAIALHSVLPVSAVLLVASTLIGANALVIVGSAAILAFKGVHPQEVTWLRWLNGKASPLQTAVYATCPLTCDTAK